MEESVVTEVEESVVGPVVVVGGGVVVHGPGVHDGFTGTVHVLVDVQSVKVMSSEARQQSALDKFKSNLKLHKKIEVCQRLLKHKYQNDTYLF